MRKLSVSVPRARLRRLRTKLERDRAKPTYIGSTTDGYVFLKEESHA
jgi:hypothetical protein